MKKSLLITILSLITTISFAQKSPNDKYCKSIERKVDEFTGLISITHPYALYGSTWVRFYKDIEKNNERYYLRLAAAGSTVNVGIKGVTVLFTDGTKWESNDKIDVKAGAGGFEYSSFILLSKSDVEVFKTKEIKKFRLYIYDHEVSQKNATSLNACFNCIVNTI